MDAALLWLVSGVTFILLELVVPGGIIVFLGCSALVVSAGIQFGYITTIQAAFLTWFITSIIFMIFLRSVFIKYFEGNSELHEVDEDKELVGSIVEIVEDVSPHKEGRVRFGDSTWIARSDFEFKVGEKALIDKRDGNVIILKVID